MIPTEMIHKSAMTVSGIMAQHYSQTVVLSSSRIGISRLEMFQSPALVNWGANYWQMARVVARGVGYSFGVNRPSSLPSSGAFRRDRCIDCAEFFKDTVLLSLHRGLLHNE